jgi:hypothetical protein
MQMKKQEEPVADDLSRFAIQTQKSEKQYEMTHETVAEANA